jgi:hypothetical protein
MPAQFHDDPQMPGARHWRSSQRLALLGSGLGLALLVLIDIATVVVGGVLLSTEKFRTTGEFALVLMATVGFLLFFVVLTLSAWRNMLGKRSASITLTRTGLTLHLRRGRSLTHPAPDCDETLAWSDVLAVETRLESYGAFGIMANLQRAYRLTRRSHDPIFLFEERALDTTLESECMHDLAEEIARWASVPLRDLGMVRGRGGAAFAWMRTPAPWTTTSLEPKVQARQWNRVVFTASGVGLVIALMWLVQFLAHVF